MTERDFKAEAAQSDLDRQHADDRIDAQKKRVEGSGTDQQKVDDQQLMNEMRVNKTGLDLNRTMQDYDEEHKDEEL